MRAHALVAALLLAAGPGLLEAQGANASRPPNVILIVTDDQGYGDIAAHGNPMIETPNLDRLSRESVRLTDFHVDPTCSPTRAALMTGRYSTRTGVWHTVAGRSLLRPQETTMAEVFARSGYRTGIFGKWHLGDNYPLRPQDRGFHEVLIHGGGAVTQTPDYWGNDYFDDHYLHNGEWRPFKGYSTEVFVGAAMRFIDANRDRPFFLYLPTNIAHAPYNVPERYAELYRRKGAKGELASFYGMITHFDEQLGLLLRRLDGAGLAENTIVIFTTDNGSAGDGFNAGLRARKGTIYEGGHRVPFFVRYPRRVTGGREIDRLTAHIDVLPTLIEVAGLKAPEGVRFDGTSLVPLFRGDAWPSRTLLVHSQRTERPVKWRNSAVMTERWRLINGKELYDVEKDLGQKTDIAAQHPDTVAALRARYEAWWTDLLPSMQTPVRIALGSDREPVVRLTAHDWHVDEDTRVPFAQTMVADPDYSGNGVWTLEVTRPGTYEFVLRARPLEAKSHPTGAARARISIGGVQQSRSVSPDAPEVRFTIPLPKGAADLQTWFERPDGRSRGAYFVYVRRVPTAAGAESPSKSLATRTDR